MTLDWCRNTAWEGSKVKFEVEGVEVGVSEH